MAGFFVSNTGNKYEQKLFSAAPCVHNAIDYNEYFISRCTLDKFLDDKLFYEDEDIIIVLEGVILNKLDLCKGIAWSRRFKQMFCDNGISCINDLRGPFSGAVFCKTAQEWYFFTSQIGDKMVFYYNYSSVLIVANSFEDVFQSIKKMDKQMHVDQVAIYDLLTFGFMTSDHTLIEGVHRIEAGHYIKWKDGKLTVHQYHRFDITQDSYNRSETQHIDTLDELFIKAVRKQFDKDLEYGYKHLTGLSGGLDSRLTTWVACEQGYADNIVSFEFGKANYLDELIAKQVAEKLNIELLIKPLDDARFLLEYAEAIKTNAGLSIFYGTAHGNSLYRLINFSDFGLVHTGDEQLFWKLMPRDDYRDTIPGRMEYAYSRTLEKKYQIVGRTYNHLWEFWMYTRGFLGNLNSTNAKNDYALHCCPFLDVEFIQYVYSMPLELWDDDYIYTKWYQAKYPDACKIPVERYKGAKIGASSLCKKIYRARHLGLGGTVNVLLQKAGINQKLFKTVFKNDMNPLEYWYRTKPNVANKMNDDAKRIMEAIRCGKILDEEVLDNMKNLYHTGSVLEKIQVMTILSAIDRYVVGGY